MRIYFVLQCLECNFLITRFVIDLIIIFPYFLSSQYEHNHLVLYLTKIGSGSESLYTADPDPHH